MSGKDRKQEPRGWGRFVITPELLAQSIGLPEDFDLVRARWVDHPNYRGVVEVTVVSSKLPETPEGAEIQEYTPLITKQKHADGTITHTWDFLTG